ncbi:MAG: DUF349 domain-containing protein [Flavobacteriales bacterium]|nr:DUF349 domain-containing protein [Flavobacteriia bacterium]NCP05033.1 DUF349 domain-containing protein [Flavobacteriales bacterium]PIV92363.1 MAG: DUF349 domain-containing protein [Flavobacteriaceae bacterium CG17_big_fil_post_rev_8_21_14_2_50_33_15]PIY10713.1 MAG: DUF349 domain-containing protein [Flavobacteriaceae bacterium CG_4_10_14_3_um_filter_33_47]PJB19417.1 MAG: DUF349 domain-containing protein [Flavobacteriaceae bacterium CG_4_9_14_3_um_filter_33_16]
MSELENLQEADGNQEIKPKKIKSKEKSAEDTAAEPNHVESTPESNTQEVDALDQSTHQSKEDLKETEASKVIEEPKETESTKPVLDEQDDLLNEIDESNAEDAEDDGNKERHIIEVKDYDTMSLEALTAELEKLVKSEKVQAIKNHVEEINNEFKTKFQSLLDEKKEEFLSDGGNEIDFYYSSPIQNRFKTTYKAYKNKLYEHYKSLEQNLKQNLEDKLDIIEELKGLINVEENINTTYKHFKELQERWRNTGPIPRDKYNNAWNSYHHHVEMFYDFLHLNRELRDLDFKHNLEKKLMIIERAEELSKDNDALHSFRELQELHKMWKEELGPVAREQREDIWNRFKNATKIINEKRQKFYQEIDKVYEKNLEKKQDIIQAIQAISTEDITSHSIWQKKIKDIDALRESFFNAGKVPVKVNEETWAHFKDAVRAFNKRKNLFYKGLKKEQYKNLQKKLELIKIAEDNKNNEDIPTTMALMKKIQSDWKKIGHVPRKDSDKIWKQFKSACNFFFDKLHASKNAANNLEAEAYTKKMTLLDSMKNLTLTHDKEKDLEIIKNTITQWKEIGRVPNDKRFIEGKFNKNLDELFSKLKMDKNDIELIKFENKLEVLSNDDDNRNLDNERAFIRKKIDELKSQINQLENNLQFFTNVDDDNPLVKEVHKNIKGHKDSLKLWKTKLSKIKELY